MSVQSVADAMKTSVEVVVTAAAFVVALAVLLVAQLLVFATHLTIGRAG